MRRLGFALVIVAAAVAAACDEEPAVINVATPAAFACVGVTADKCDELVTQAKSDFNVTSFQSIRIVCTRPPCTDQSGEVSIDAILRDGSRQSSGSSWATLGNPIGNPGPTD